MLLPVYPLSCRPDLCSHRLVVDEEEWYDGVGFPRVWRVCLTCGLCYERGKTMRELEHAIRERSRLPPRSEMIDDELAQEFWWGRT